MRDEIMPVYASLGREGQPALILMRRALDAAAKAMAEGDVIAMIQAYEDLKGFEL